MMYTMLLSTLAPLMFGALALAQAGTSPSADATAIHEIVAAQTAAWNRHDAKAFAERFAPDGGFTNIIGMQTYGREPFERQHTAIFSSIYKDSSAKFAIGKIRFIRPDVAVVDVDAEVTGYSSMPPGMPAPLDGILRTRLQEVLVKESTGWWVTAFHNVVLQSVKKPE